MPQRRWRLGLASTVLLASALSHATLARTEASLYGGGVVRVGLVRHFRDVKQVTLLASSDYAVLRTGSIDKLASCTNLEPVTLTAGPRVITLRRANGSSADVGASVTIAPNEASGTVGVDSPGRPSKEYRGTIEVAIRAGNLQLVNIASLEDYLPGVLAGEMPSSYPDEALKAQAIAARTFTIRAHGRHTPLGFDVCDDSHCQVYDGLLREKPSCTRAVLATKGQVLTYGGRVASIMYCADCGGATECYAEAHSEAVPYLTSVTEPSGLAHCTWQETFTVTELSAKLVAAGIKAAGGLQKIRVAKTSTSGRALSIEITGNKATASIAAIRLRSVLGRDAIRSTLFTIDMSSDGAVTFAGRGFGHGIGLCQVGAKGLASRPYNYTCEQILAHYYPGTALTPAPTLVERVTPAQTSQMARPAAKSKRRQAAALHRHPSTDSQTKQSDSLDVRVEEPTLQ